MIERDLAEEGTVCAARSVYLALTQIASDRQSDRFEASIDQIAYRAGLSRKWAGKILGQLEQLGLVNIERRQGIGVLKAPSIYTLTAIGIACAPTSVMGTDSPSMGTSQQSASSSDIQKESPKESKQEFPATTTKRKDLADDPLLEIVSGVQDADELCNLLRPQFPKLSMRRELDKCRRDRQKKGRVTSLTAKVFVQWLRRADPEIRASKKPVAPTQKRTSEGEDHAIRKKGITILKNCRLRLRDSSRNVSTADEGQSLQCDLDSAG